MKIENGQVLDYVSAFHLLRHRRNASQSEYSLLARIRELFNPARPLGGVEGDSLVFPVGRQGTIWTPSTRITVEILRVTLWSATVRCRRAYRKGAVVGLSAEDERGDVHSFAARVLHHASDTNNLTLRIHRTLTRATCRA